MQDQGFQHVTLSCPLRGLAVGGCPGSGLSLRPLINLSSIGRWSGALRNPSSSEFSGFSLESISFPGSTQQWHFLWWGAPMCDSGQEEPSPRNWLHVVAHPALSYSYSELRAWDSALSRRTSCVCGIRTTGL